MEERDRASEGDMIWRHLASWEPPLLSSPLIPNNYVVLSIFYHDAIYRIRSDESRAGCSRTCRSAVPSDRRVQRPCSRWRIDHSGGRMNLRLQGNCGSGSSLCFGRHCKVQRENKDHHRSNGKRRWERWDARRRRSRQTRR